MCGTNAQPTPVCRQLPAKPRPMPKFSFLSPFLTSRPHCPQPSSSSFLLLPHATLEGEGKRRGEVLKLLAAMSAVQPGRQGR